MAHFCLHNHPTGVQNISRPRLANKGENTAMPKYTSLQEVENEIRSQCNRHLAAIREWVLDKRPTVGDKDAKIGGAYMLILQHDWGGRDITGRLNVGMKISEAARAIWQAPMLGTPAA